MSSDVMTVVDAPTMPMLFAAALEPLPALPPTPDNLVASTLIEGNALPAFCANAELTSAVPARHAAAKESLRVAAEKRYPGE